MSKSDARKPPSRSITYKDQPGRRPRTRTAYNAAMDPLTTRAIEDYHRLLEKDGALARDLEASFLDRMRAARMTFGGSRVLCPFPRPNFISPLLYQRIQAVCRGFFRAVEKVE